MEDLANSDRIIPRCNIAWCGLLLDLHICGDASEAIAREGKRLPRTSK
jgi:hypothetical protein